MELGQDNRINQVIDTALKNVNELIDVNTVIGKPYEMGAGELIFPISKVTVGLISGGGEYGKVGLFKTEKDLPYSVGNGSIISLKPCGFLIKSITNDYSFISVGNSKYDVLIEKASEFLDKIQGNNDDWQKHYKI